MLGKRELPYVREKGASSVHGKSSISMQKELLICQCKKDFIHVRQKEFLTYQCKRGILCYNAMTVNVVNGLLWSSYVEMW